MGMAGHKANAALKERFPTRRHRTNSARRRRVRVCEWLAKKQHYSVCPHVDAFVDALVAQKEIAGYIGVVREEELEHDVAEMMIGEMVISVDESCAKTCH